MNQTKSTSKKLLALLLALIMTVSLLPMSVFAAELATDEPAQEAEEVIDVPADGENAEDVEPVDGEEDGVSVYAAADEIAVQAATDGELKYRIVHIDCGRKYFSVDYIKSILTTMAENGFNQLELAFGNGGLRFVLDDMDIKSGTSTLHNSQDVKDAILEGNKKFYDDPNGNVLTEAEMLEIIAHATKVGVEIVPLLNMPGHMDGILGSSLFSKYKLSGSDGSLDLNNADAVTFGKALLKLYVDWFDQNGNSIYFNFGADEYGQGIRNPYIESSVAKVTYDQLINYMNDCANVIEGEGMTARCFNDFVCYNKRTSCNLSKTVQVCYWSNQWNGSEYNTPDVIQNAGYTMINTNQKWYFVPSKAEEYGKNVVLSNFSSFDVAKYQNIKSGYNPTSTTYTEIPVGTTNVGAMFCVWCDTPSVDVALTDVQELIAAMADANPSYFTKKTVETPVIKQDDKTVSGSALQVALGTTTTLTLTGNQTASWSSSNETVLKLEAVSTTRAAGIEAAQVKIIPVSVGTATVTAELSDGTELSTEVTVTAAPEKEKVYVAVQHGKTSDVYEQTGDCTGEYSDEYVKVTTTATTETGGTRYELAALTAGTFYVANNSSVQDNAELSQLTFESAQNGQYYIKNSDGRYVYPNATYRQNKLSYSATASNSRTAVNVETNNDGSITISRNVSYNNGRYTTTTTTAYLTISDGGATGASGSSSNIYLYNQKNVPGGQKTSITFEGLQLVEDRVYTIGNVEYHVTVTEIDLSEITVDINLWITNGGVLPDGWSNGSPSGFVFNNQVSVNNGNWTNMAYRTVSAAQYGFYSETGNELTAILDGTLTGTAASKDEITVDVEYWKSAYHAADKRQEWDGWTNHTNDGVEIKYLRYWDNTWAYSVDGRTWVAISNISATDRNENQLAIFYRQPTKITDEVETKVVDWGPIKFASPQSLLDFAVKYESGEKTPTSFPVTDKTIGFNCPTDQAAAIENGYVVKSGTTYYRVVHGIAGVETSNYEVYMITVTPSSDEPGTTLSSYSNYSYGGTEKIAWAKTEADAENAGMELLNDGVTTVTYGGEPYLDKVKIYQKQGLLVTYYVRAKATEDALTVHYINRTLGNTEFFSYNIAVAQGTKFKQDIALADPNWKTYLINGEVTNIFNREQRITADLAQMPAIDAKYRYAVYKCVEVERRDDKNVYLYYVFSNETSFVVDFGLNLLIPLTRLSGDLGNAQITSVTVSGAKYGKTTYDSGKRQITYQPTKTIDDVEKLSIEITGNITYTNDEGHEVTREGTVSYLVNVIPASTVYYEDSFVTFSEEGDAENIVGWTRVADVGEKPDEVIAAEKNTTQALEELGGDATGKNVYGYDPAYDSCTTFSMGSAMKTTVSDDNYATATFTFKGTGFDIISLTDNTSGAIVVDVYSGSTATGTKVKSHIVDNYYGYKQETTADNKVTWVVDKENKNCLYQIPVMKIDGLPHGEYTAVITVFYDGAFDHTAAGTEYSFWLDAIRVYNPMGEDYTDYTRDGEGYPQYIKLRDELASSEAAIAESGVVFIDGGNVAEVDTYANYGPNNEVYLASGQAITFKLTGDLTNVDKIQIGAKSPDGTEGKAKLSVNSKEIASATEMYYDITDYANGDKLVTIANDGAEGTILSLTNLKVTFNKAGKSVSFASLSTENQDEAVATVRALFAAPVEPDPEPVIFTPERFEVSWNRSTVKVGQKATLTVKTSEDVEAITVDGVTIDTYRTRTQRTGWGWNAKKVTYREFTYTITANEAGTLNCSVAAVNAEGVTSEAITAALTVQAAAQRPSWGSWLDKIFSRWF